MTVTADDIKRVLDAYLLDDADADFMVASSSKYTVKGAGGFRKRLIKSGTHLRLIGVYAGRREPIIWQFKAGDTTDPAEIVEIPDKTAGVALAGFRDFSKAMKKTAQEGIAKRPAPAALADAKEEIEEEKVNKLAEDFDNSAVFGSW